jgi:hypothetical protein
MERTGRKTSRGPSRKAAGSKTNETANGSVAKPDNGRHSAALKASLTVAQLNAVDLLAAGRNDRETAEAIGVSRQTVTAWRGCLPVFQAELNKRRREVWGAAADRLRALLPLALDRLAAALEGEDATAVALAIVRLARPDLSAIGPDDPADVVSELANERDRSLVNLIASVVRTGDGEDPRSALERQLAAEYERLTNEPPDDEGSA